MLEPPRIVAWIAARIVAALPDLDHIVPNQCGMTRIADLVTPPETPDGEMHAPLRTLSWKELVARLDAARAARGATAHISSREPGSFSAGIVDQFRQPDDGKRGVNPIVLGHGKHRTSMSDACTKPAPREDRDQR